MKSVQSVSDRPKTPAGRTVDGGGWDYDVVVIGAGPYGLSAGAYLKAAGLKVCVFGEPMSFWADRMPAGMLLRSPREASNLADPRAALTLGAFEKATGRPPSAPVPLETFVKYGRWFQQQVSFDLDRRLVGTVKGDGAAFRITLQDGTSLKSPRVIVAAGIESFHRKPAVFGELPGNMASHCYEGTKISALSDKHVAVIGAGQSALESAALLAESGAKVELIAKIPELRWIGMHKWLHQLGPLSKALYSKYDVGPAGISRLVATPKLVYHVPQKFKDRIRVRAVRPAGSRWLPERLKNVTLSTGLAVQTAKAVGQQVHLRLDDGSERRVHHVLMGTGYDVDIARYSFLDRQLVAEIQRLGGYPNLGAGFRCSVPGLHFIGAPAARNFGPLLYFVAGTEFAAKELTSYVSRQKTTARGQRL